MKCDIVTIIGARPQFIKAAVVSRALKAANISEDIVHTGQHYDDKMSGQFLRDLGIDNVVVNLEVGSGGHADQTARIMTGFDSYLARRAAPPSAVVVYGDTNSTIAAALVVSKLGIPLVHVEAGLRSYNRDMPEEINRVVVDHLSEVLFCSSHVGVQNLANEGIVKGVHDVGDVMFDAFQHFSVHSGERCISGVDLNEPFILVTLHRPGNTDHATRMQAILDSLGRTATRCIWPVHPRNVERLATMTMPANLVCIPPQGYLEMLALLDGCRAVVTDSGGLQKEAYWAKRSCVTVRGETEWVETLSGGWNRLADPLMQDIAELAAVAPHTEWVPLYGDGCASSRIARVIAASFE